MMIPRAPARGSSGAAKRRQHLAVGVSPWNPKGTHPSRVGGDSNHNLVFGLK